MNYETLLEKTRDALETLAAARALVHDVKEAVADGRAGMTLAQKNEITALLGQMTAESVAINDRIQRA